MKKKDKLKQPGYYLIWAVTTGRFYPSLWNPVLWESKEYGKGQKDNVLKAHQITPEETELALSGELSLDELAERYPLPSGFVEEYKRQKEDV